MVANLKFKISLFTLFLRVNLLKSMEYRFNFFASILPTGFYSLGYLVFLKTIFSKVPTIAGWTFDKLLILFMIEQLIYFSALFLYRQSLNNLDLHVREGTFDYFLKLPRELRLLVSFKDQDLFSLAPVTMYLSVLIYLLIKLHIALPTILLSIPLLIIGGIIFYNFMFILASSCFWFTESKEVLDLADEATDLSRYPFDVYHPVLAVVLMTLIPTLLIVYVPASSLLGALNWQLVLVLLFVLAASSFASQKIWQAGLRRYSSASS